MKDVIETEIKEDTNGAVSPLGHKLLRILGFIAKQVKTGKCSDEEIADLMVLASSERLGYIREEDYVTADEGMKILGVGKNRAQFFALIKQYGIEANTFNNVKIGYKRNDIIKLKVALSKDKDNFILKKKRKKYPLSEMLED